MRVLIADDSVLLREGLRLLLEEDGHVIAAAVGDGDALVSESLRLRPDLVIADIRMPPSHTDEGLRASVRLRAEWPEAPILLLSQYVVAAYAEELLASGTGAIGYLLKDRVADIDSFLDAVRRVADGGVVLDPEVVTQVFRRQRSTGGGDDRAGTSAATPGGADRSALASLTPREREVLALMAEGHTNAVIAERLVVTEGAIEKHSQRLFAKLGLSESDSVHRRVAAVLRFVRG